MAIDIIHFACNEIHHNIKHLNECSLHFAVDVKLHSPVRQLAATRSYSVCVSDAPCKSDAASIAYFVSETKIEHRAVRAM